MQHDKQKQRTIVGSFPAPTILLLVIGLVPMLFAPGAKANVCDDAQTITANVVVLDNPTVFNRLGAQNPNWITYALERDVVDKSTQIPCSMGACTPGKVELRPDKRTRPLVVRSVAGACLTVNFTNLLAPVANPNNPIQACPRAWQRRRQRSPADPR